MPANPSTRHLIAGLHSRGVLPHLKREGGAYFVTCRQAGSLPAEVMLRFKQERNAIISRSIAANRPLTWHERESLFRWYSRRVDRYLDAASGACYFKDAECADTIAGAIKFFDRERYELRAWVVMPNHIHAVLMPLAHYSLSSIIHSWKSYTAHKLKKRLPNISGPIWQRESYDHLIRDSHDLERCCDYTTMNPVNARLCADPSHWRWSSAYKVA